MRIATGGVSHETSTFLPTRTTTRDFVDTKGIFRGNEFIDHFRDTNTPTGGFVDGAKEHGIELVPLLWAFANPGGPIVREDYEALKAEFLELLRNGESENGPFDGVLLDMHGAMVIDGIDDGDGDFIEAVREVVGADHPIVVTQDLHASHTERRVAAADALIGYDTFPHVDMAERGREAAELIARTVRGEVRPVMALHQLPMLWSAVCQVSTQPPMDEALRHIHEIEQRPGVLVVTLSTAFPWSDVPDVGSSVIVVTDADPALARSTADELGAWVWERRERWWKKPLTVSEALAEGERVGNYPIFLADHADNTGSGTPGDSTEVLQTFLDLGLQDALVLYITDREVAEQAHAVGVGGRMSTAVGGKSHPAQGPPVQMEAEVVAVSDGRFAYDGPMFAGMMGKHGPSAWLRSGGVSVVVVSAREQPFDQAFARSLGIDPAAMRYIGVKSAGHFRSGFGSIIGSSYNINAQAIHSVDFTRMGYKRAKRRLYPDQEH